MKKLFTAVRRGDLETLRCAIERKPELVHCISGMVRMYLTFARIST